MMDLALPPASSDTLHSGIGEHKARGTKPERSGYQTSPHVENKPENNVCEMVDYRSRRVASFNVDGRQLICLPQAFEIFLKHLVGGLHTVYTKLKRLEITPVVCNVEQVRILRGVAAIQPGVNRCKLISPHEFDVLFDDCTSSSARPGRPPKRSSFYSSTESEISPHKQMRRSQVDSTAFPFDDLKPVHTTAPPVSYPSLPLPGMPFVSPYQINMMHQAAVQMALANHIQSSLRAKDGGAPPPLPLYNPRIQAIESNFPPSVLQSPASPKTRPHIEATLSNIHPLPARSTAPCLSPHNSDKPRDTIHNSIDIIDRCKQLSPSVKSCCSEDLNVDDVTHNSPDSKSHELRHHTMPTPPPSSPREPEDNSLAEEKFFSSPVGSRLQCGEAEEIPENSVSRLPGHLPNTDSESERKLALVTEEDKQSLQDALTSMKSDIQSFMDSVLQHQEDLLADIETLRERLKTSVYNKAFLDVLVREQQQAKSLYEAHREKDELHRHKIDQLLRMTKSDLPDRW